MLKIFVLASAILFLNACQTAGLGRGSVGGIDGQGPILIEDGVGGGPRDSGKIEVENLGDGLPPQQGEPLATEGGTMEQPPAEPVPEKTQVALVFGPGGVRTFADIGFLTAFWKSKIPVSTIVGLESATIASAVYAFKGKAFDVEWQMRKLKDDDWVERGLFHGWKEKSPSDFDQFLDGYFAGQSVANQTVDWYCGKSFISVNFQSPKEQSWKDSIKNCLGRPPLFKGNFDLEKEVIGNPALLISKVNTTIKELMNRKATKVIYVDVLSVSPPEGESWNTDLEVQRAIEKRVHYFIKLPISADPWDIGQRRELMNIGKQAGEEFVERLKEDLNL